MPASSSSSSVPVIKGYIPVRLRIPRQLQLARNRNGNNNDDGNDNGNDTEDTFFFVREHQGKSAEDDSEGTAAATTTTTTKKGTTLFVANAPVVPGVSTKLLLRSIFGRFAEVSRVTAVRNPRAAAAAAAAGGDGTTLSTVNSSSSNSGSSFGGTEGESILAWTDKEKFFRPTFLPPILSETEGKYAHVVFASPKELKTAKKALEQIMSGASSSSYTNASSFSSSRRRNKGRKNSGNTNNNEGEERNDRAVVLDKLELQTLSDESQRQHAELAVARRYRESCRILNNRARLLEECNAVMEAYEDAEEAKRRAREAARAEPDDDGFVTVSYSGSSNVGSKIEFEQSATATTPSRRKGNKRTRKKKEAAGAGELTDFYRFQRADTRKRTMQDLRRQFEEDVRKVKRLKEEKEYRPF
eukprot:jgi/Psemu1/283583/fgenesh1_pg.30_\